MDDTIRLIRGREENRKKGDNNYTIPGKHCIVTMRFSLLSSFLDPLHLISPICNQQTKIANVTPAKVHAGS